MVGTPSDGVLKSNLVSPNLFCLVFLMVRPRGVSLVLDESLHINGIEV